MLILFDIDMTLLESRHIGMRCLHETGLEEFDKDFTVEGIKFGGGIDPDIITRMLEMNGVDVTDDNLLRMRVGYRDRLLSAATEEEVSQALPGAHELVEATRKMRLKPTIGLLTGNFEETGTIKLREAGFEMSDFEICVWGDDSPHHPPLRSHLPPVAIERYASLKGCTPESESVIIVGDTVHDVSCALDSGCKVLAVATGHASSDELHDAGAHHVIDDLCDTEGILKWLSNQLHPFARANA
jgi:phosphoglycolate phosphatase